MNQRLAPYAIEFVLVMSALLFSCAIVASIMVAVSEANTNKARCEEIGGVWINYEKLLGCYEVKELHR